MIWHKRSLINSQIVLKLILFFQVLFFAIFIYTDDVTLQRLFVLAIFFIEIGHNYLKLIKMLSLKKSLDVLKSRRIKTTNPNYFLSN